MERTKVVGVGTWPNVGDKVVFTVVANSFGINGYAMDASVNGNSIGYLYQNPKFDEPGFIGLTEVFKLIGDPAEHEGETWTGEIKSVGANTTARGRGWVAESVIDISSAEYNKKDSNTKGKKGKKNTMKNHAVTTVTLYCEGRKRNPYGLDFSARTKNENVLKAGTAGDDGNIITVPVTFEKDVRNGIVLVQAPGVGLIGYIVDGNGATMTATELGKRLDDGAEYEAKIVGNEKFLRLIIEVKFQPSKKAEATMNNAVALMGLAEYQRRLNDYTSQGLSDENIQELFGYIVAYATKEVEDCPKFVPVWDQAFNYIARSPSELMNGMRKFYLGYPILAFGDPGCGKDQFLLYLAAQYGVVPHRMTMDGNVDGDTLIGTNSLIETERGNVVTGPTKSMLMQLMERPVFCIVDEINYVAPDQAGGLNAATERNVSVDKMLGKVKETITAINTPNGMTVQKHPSFRIAFTMNLGLAGCKQLNDSFWNRTSKLPMEAHVSVSKILGSKFEMSPADLKVCEKIWGAIKNAANNMGIEAVTDVSIRDFERACEMAVVCHIDIREALESEVITSIQDPIMQEGVRKALAAL